MKRAILLLLALALASGSALAHGRSRVFLGFNFGFPVYHPWYPAYYPAPVYYPVAPVYVQPSEPPVYQQRGDVVPEGPGTWYFCREANGYYPYVKQCPGGWQRVPAQPSN
jgi:hypothetical protein